MLIERNSRLAFNRRNAKVYARRQKKQRTWLLMLALALALFCGFKAFSATKNGIDPVPVAAGQTVEEVQAATVPPPIRVGIQAGHWKNTEIPDELDALYWNTGAAAGGHEEWEINLEIANLTAEKLRQEGITVDVLPATVPEGYSADAFIALHADGNEDTSVNGYKVAWSDWDNDGKAAALSKSIEEAYGEATTIDLDSEMAISEDMTQYYAFNFVKYHHAITSDTPGMLLEMGYITNTADRIFLVNHPEKVAEGISNGILHYLNSRP